MPEWFGCHGQKVLIASRINHLRVVHPAHQGQRRWHEKYLHMSSLGSSSAQPVQGLALRRRPGADTWHGRSTISFLASTARHLAIAGGAASLDIPYRQLYSSIQREIVIEKQQAGPLYIYHIIPLFLRGMTSPLSGSFTWMPRWPP